MAITLTSDPITTEDTVYELLRISGDQARLLINSASESFLMFTNRLRITSATVTEYQRGTGLGVIYLRAAPVASVTSLEYYANGALSDTLTASDYQIDLPTGRIATYTKAPPYSDDERNIKIVYSGGWTAGALPGDVVYGALERSL
jgi:hypothetical protein